MILYHGSYVEIKTPDLNYGRYNLDFGKGFYVTGLKEQAKKWAFRRATMVKMIQGFDNAKPIVTVYDIDLDHTELEILSFNGYTEEWLDFIVKNRSLKESSVSSRYDIIFGNVADDDVAAMVDDYMRLLLKGRMDMEDKRFFLRQLQYSKPNDQYCFATEKALDSLKYVKSYSLED